MRTNFDTLRAMASFLLSHLQESQIAEFASDKRSDLIESLATELGVSFATDEDVKEQGIEEVHEKFGDDLQGEITETEMFNHARKEIIKSFSGEHLAGLYLTESLHNVALRIKDYLLDCDDIDEVYATDHELIEFVVLQIKKFSPKKSA